MTEKRNGGGTASPRPTSLAAKAQVVIHLWMIAALLTLIVRGALS
jgi:hypothetical protein